LPLTAVAIALSLLMFLLALLMSVEAPIIPPPVAAAAAASPAEADGKPDLNSNQPAAPAKPGKMTPEQMKSALLDTVSLELMLFLVFGLVVLLSSRSGRVHLADNNVADVAAVSESSGNPLPVSSNSLWPDLNDASAIPQLPEYSILGERRTASQPSAVIVPEDSFYAPSRDASFSSVVSASPQLSSEPEESFSFRTELRYAGEVFLAAYLPTALLRLLVVLLTVDLMGEEPSQHPFLEMMNSGVSVSIIALIVMTAVFFAPLVEELQFRVVMLGGIAQAGRPVLAITVSSIFFALAHGFPDSIALLPLAFALGYAYLRRRSYITVMLVHFLFNGFNMALALLALL
jgi:membrane protease YdiL (CAAX protease family)